MLGGVGGTGEEQCGDEEIKGGEWDWGGDLRVGGGVGGWGFKGGVFGMWGSKARSGKEGSCTKRRMSSHSSLLTLSLSFPFSFSRFCSILPLYHFSFSCSILTLTSTPSSSNLFPGKHLHSSQISFCRLPLWHWCIGCSYDEREIWMRLDPSLLNSISPISSFSILLPPPLPSPSFSP